MIEENLNYLSNHFLIAMPQLDDPNFSHTVTYICEHSSEGALGIVINRPMGIELQEVLDHLELKAEAPEVAQMPVYVGGPVHKERGFVLHSPIGQWESSLKITDDIAVTSSRDILAAMANNEGPEDVLIALGYAGWGAGQLEQEILDNAWLSGPADHSILFNTPYNERWRAAAGLLGVDPDNISTDAGHA